MQLQNQDSDSVSPLCSTQPFFSISFEEEEKKKEEQEEEEDEQLEHHVQLENLVTSHLSRKIGKVNAKGTGGG